MRRYVLLGVLCSRRLSFSAKRGQLERDDAQPIFLSLLSSTARSRPEKSSKCVLFVQGCVCASIGFEMDHEKPARANEAGSLSTTTFPPLFSKRTLSPVSPFPSTPTKLQSPFISWLPSRSSSRTAALKDGYYSEDATRTTGRRSSSSYSRRAAGLRVSFSTFPSS